MFKSVSQCAAIAATLAAGQFAAAAIYSADFESPTYTVDTAINGQAGWTGTNGNSLVRGSSYGGGWASHGQYLVTNGTANFGESPSFTPTGSTVSTVSFDVRPGDSAVAGGQSAAIIYLLDDASPNRKMMFSMDFRSDGNGSLSKGSIFATYGDAYYNTNIPWEYVDHNTSYHVDLTLDSSTTDWTMSINGGTALTGDFGGVFGFSASTGGEPGAIWFRGGQNNNPGGLVSYDNLVVAPEPAALSLLGLAALGMIRRRK